MKRLMTGVLTAATGIALLAGCSTPDGSAGAGGSPTTPSPVVSDVAQTPTPTPTATAEPTPASIPTDCTDVLDQATYEATMGDAPLNDPRHFTEPMGQVAPSAPPADADLRGVVDAADVLRCGWRDPMADITGLFVDISVVDETTASTYPAWLAEGREPTTEYFLDGVAYDCSDSDAYEGTLCQYTATHEMYGVDMTDTVLVRDDVVVTVGQSNVPTDDLMGSIVSRIWG
jgi:hypothetical protein